MPRVSATSSTGSSSSMRHPQGYQHNNSMRWQHCLALALQLKLKQLSISLINEFCHHHSLAALPEARSAAACYLCAAAAEAGAAAHLASC
jgi:hypothetical protein